MQCWKALQAYFSEPRDYSLQCGVFKIRPYLARAAGFWKTNMQTTAQPFTPQHLPLSLVNKPNLTTAETAYYLNRRPQTLRGWACLENGPLRPVRVHGRLAWPVSEIRRVLQVTA